MKHQNHRMMVNTDNEWPAEELREKTNILHGSTDRREIGRQIPSIAKGKVGLASAHYHRAVSELAYELWEKRQHPQGSTEVDWFKAEETLKPLWSADLSFAWENSASNNPGKL